MDLPRFNSGKVGSLEWFHLNYVFDVIESGRPQSRPQRKQDDEWIYATLTNVAVVQAGQISNRWSWNEIQRDPSTGGFSVVQGGRTSTYGDDPFFIPAIPVSGTEAYEIGDLVLLRLSRFANGSPYAVIVKPSGSAVSLFEIVGNSPGPSGRWTYTGRLRSFDGSIGWFDASSTTNFTLYNSCENVVDAANSIGVGTVKPSSATAIRQPIKNGTIVMAVYSESAWVFSIPNGYSFGCA